MKLRPRSRARSFFNHGTIFFITPAALVIAFGVVAGVALLLSPGSTTGTLRDWLLSSRPAPLNEKLATEFPVLKGSMAARTTRFDKTTRMVGGREVAGLTGRVEEAKGANGSGGAWAMTAGLKSAKKGTRRSMAEREGSGAGEFGAFYPEQYTDSFVVEGGGVSAVVRPLGAQASAAAVENGHVVYRGAYTETDSLHALGAGRSEEFLYLRSSQAPRRFEYELSEVKGAKEVIVENGGVRFAGEAGPGLKIEAPWVVDSRGEKREDVVRWELGEAGADGKRRLTLVVAKEAELSYPLVIDPTWQLSGFRMNAARVQPTATLLPDGSLLVVGGEYFQQSSAAAELYSFRDGHFWRWYYTDPMATERMNHTATLLPDGRVLVAGGITDNEFNVHKSAELYNPATGRWTPTGSMNTAHGYHTATLLPNGKVLVVGGKYIGGRNSESSSNSAELYDPATGVWTPTGFLNSARHSHTATLLPNGKVLVAGGATFTSTLNSAELYDPATGVWTPTGSLNSARFSHTATLLPNGKVLVVGGQTFGELYDPATGTWTWTNPMNTGRYNHTATLLPNGKVLVAGGLNGGSLKSAELYDPAKNTWAETDNLYFSRDGHVAALLPNGTVVAAGGFDTKYIEEGTSERYHYWTETYFPQEEMWTPTGSLNTARREHTATLLSNGKVLVAGGEGSGVALGTAELEDPATGACAPTGSLNTARSQHTATLLPNGKVLVAGGQNGNGLNVAELYDPATGAWTPTSPLNAPRYNHTATLLPNGKVLVAGGEYNGIGVNLAELYDPATGTWTPTLPLNAPRYNHTATLLPNGKVLVAGGHNGITYLNSAELYDPATGVWTTTTGPLNAARNNHTATLLPNGKVLVTGGEGSGGALKVAELYDPATGTWTPTGSLNTARREHTATLLPNGKVLVAGGYNGTNALNSAELYDPAAGTWAAVISLNAPRYSHTATLLPNGSVLVAGGYDGTAALNSAELYDPAAGTWTQTSPLNAARFQHTTTLLPNGKVLVAGGAIPGVALNSAELYDPAAGTWTTTGSLNAARHIHTATLLPNGKVLVVGGWNAGALNSAEVYDPAAGTWTQTSPLNAARFQHTATLLPDGKVLVTGGYNGTTALNSAELYDPTVETWTTTSPLNAARFQHTTTLLPNGKVLVAGGAIPGVALNSAELYDPAAGTWTTTGSLNAARHIHTATLLPNGKVLVVGGWNAGALNSAEVYDPAAGTWTTTSPLNGARYHHTATLLPNGKVLVAGGHNGGDLSSAKLYDPATGAWTPTLPLKAARYYHTATLLPNGKVLVTGGQNGSGSLNSAELYDTGLGFPSSFQPVITSVASVLQLGSKLSLTGTRFQGVSGSSSDNTQGSQTNYPVVQLLSLSDGQARFLYSDPATNWSSTSFISRPITDFPRGYALVTVFANGIPSDARLIRVRSPHLTTFSNLSSATITYGDTPTTLSGKITTDTGYPSGNVSIRLNGVAQQAAIQSDGTFSSNFNTSTLSGSGSPYTIVYGYLGDATYEGTTDKSKTVTVNKATAAVALSNLTHDFDGTAKFATATTNPAGLPVGITYNQGGSPVSSPTKAGSYDILAVINDPNYQGSATGTLVINPDTVVPTVTINQAAGQADPTFYSPLNFTVIFSEPVTNFSTGDVTFINNTTGATSAVVTGSGTTYNVVVSGMTADGIVKVSIPAGAAVDVADNPNQASTTTDDEVTYTGISHNSFVVTKTADTNDGLCDADCSLREAILATNNTPGKGTITFDLPGAGPHVIQLQTGLPAISESVDILNTSGESITVKGYGGRSYSFLNIFTVNAGQTVNMSYLTISHGWGQGGGIRVYGTLNLTNSTVTDNNSPAEGGGIYNGGTLNLTDCTVSNNTSGITSDPDQGNIYSATGYGGGIYNGGTLNITNSTLSGNSAPSRLNNPSFNPSGRGGAIYNRGTLNATNSTVYGNNALTGGGIYNDGGAATLRSTIVAGNSAINVFDTDLGRYVYIAPNLKGPFNSEGFNLLHFGSGEATITETANADTNLLNVAPNLDGTLADNGGPTKTHKLNSGSPAIDKGKNFSTAATDQRGMQRLYDDPSVDNAAGGDGTDIGACEDVDGDPDGDTLTNFQELSLGSNPNSIDSDADGYNDATEMLAQTNPASASSVPLSTHVERVLGYGPARGLDLTGNFAYAFNVGTNGAVGQAGDANFTADSAPGITMSAPNQVNPWGAPSFGSTAADDVLENVYKSIRWANSVDANPALRTITVDLSGLTVGRRYKLQLLFGESCCNRNFDISVEGSLVADDFKPALAQGSLSLTRAGSAFVHEFVATDTTLNIVLDASNVADPSLDRNPILNGVTLERLPEAVAPVITAVGVARTQGDSATNSVIANNISDSQQAPGALTVTVNGQSASGANSVTSNGVSISNLAIAADGTATADVAAACNAATPGVNFTLRVTNGNNFFSEATLTVTVNTPAANHLGFGQQPANTVAGQTITPAVTVGILNQCNAVVSSTDSVTIGIGTNPAGGTLGGTTTVAAVGGTATFSNLFINKTGAGYTLSATSGSLTGATSGGFNISAAAAAGISATTGAPQSATINAAFATAMQATVTDGGGNPVSGVTVTFTAPASGASGKFSNITITTTATSNASGVATASTFTANGTAGSYNVTASINGGSPSTTFSLTNNTANQTINVTTHAPASVAYNSQFTVAATSTSGLPVTYSSSGSCTNTGATFTMTNGTGTCTVKYDQAGNANYNSATQITESVTAQKVTPTITFGALTGKTYGDAPFTISATGGASGNPIIFGSRTPTVCSVSSNTVSILSAGTCTIRASQAGNDNYNAASDVDQSFTVVKANQTITFGALTNKTFGDPDFDVSATAGSGLAVSFTADGQCTVTGTTVHITGAGTCTITASQAGDGNYNAAAANVSITVDPVTAAAFNLDSANYTVNEGDGHVTITVSRTGSGGGAASVNYTTSDNAALTDCNIFNGIASSRCDYAITVGTLRFAAGEMSKTILIPLVYDSYAEGPENFSIVLSNAAGENLGAVSTATIAITDNDAVTGPNPIGGADFFVREHYIDFLGREPEPGGFAGWTNILNNCPASGKDAQGNYCDLIEVSAGFFRSEEFQSRGYFIYRFYSSIGRIPHYGEFMPDFARVSGFLSAQQLETNKAEFVTEFMNRQEFRNRYGMLSDPAAYVDALLQTTGLQSHPMRSEWVTGLTNGTMTRAQVLRALVESSEVYRKYFNEAFVVMQYFGYLRRDPDIHYLEWIETLNQTGDYRTMINGFLNSAEYRQRFGPQ
jgi:CSLREA domain-containing protein